MLHISGPVFNLLVPFLLSLSLRSFSNIQILKKLDEVETEKMTKVSEKIKNIIPSISIVTS